MSDIEAFQIGPRNIPSRYSYSREVYENSSGRLGWLSDSESVAIVRCYGALHNMNGQIAEFTSARRQDREIDEDRVAASKQASSEVRSRYKALKKSFEEAKLHRRAALHLLEDNIS